MGRIGSGSESLVECQWASSFKLQTHECQAFHLKFLIRPSIILSQPICVISKQAKVLASVVREMFKLVMGKSSEQLSAVSAKSPYGMAGDKQKTTVYDDAQPSPLRGDCTFISERWLMLFNVVG